ncbi:craniofacial development protein 2-like [Elysia marginata]|uniref:Craniofacial development protein 2-like n=1 Tax=Elysia marginata TaxID=1093978 RepID=A0AAV4HBS0_9GAST|nr:craniofacial development protein 2-like [Elysia marginata]
MSTGKGAAREIKDTVGPHGIGDINARGERLVEWCGEHDYFITNTGTQFQNQPRRCWTGMSPGDRGRNQIDFIIAPKRFRNYAILSSKSMPGTDCGSGHVPLVCVMRIKLKKLKKPKQTLKFQYDALKKNVEPKRKFNVTIENKFAVLDELTEVEQKWGQKKECTENLSQRKRIGSTKNG